MMTMMEEESLDAFKKRVQNIGKKSKSKIRDCFGIYDIYKYIRKNKWYNIGRPVTEHEFYSIVRKVNNLLAAELGKGNNITLPHKMGKLELRRFERGVSIVNGKMKITYPIDWAETVRLWFEDEEARKNKTVKRFEDKYTYHIRYNKWGAVYENKSFYEFLINRNIKKALQNNIKKGEVNVLW